MAIYDIPFLSKATNAFTGSATFGGSQVSLTADGAEFNTTYAGVTTTRLKTDISGGLLSVDGANALRLRSNGVDRLTIAGGGAVGIGGTPTSNVGIRLLGSPAATTSQTGIMSNLTFTSAATSEGIGFLSSIATQATAFTMPSLYNYYAGNATKGAGSTITTQYGLYVESLTSGATNYAIYTNTGLVRFGDTVTMNGVNRLLGTGAAAGTAAGWRFGDTNSGSSRDWAISNGIGSSGAAIGALIFSISTALSGDPLAAGTEVLRLASGAVTATGSLRATTGFGCNGATVQTAFASGGAAPAGGTGTAAGGWDTAAHRDAAITLLNNIRSALVANGIMS